MPPEAWESEHQRKGKHLQFCVWTLDTLSDLNAKQALGLDLAIGNISESKEAALRWAVSHVDVKCLRTTLKWKR